MYVQVSGSYYGNLKRKRKEREKQRNKRAQRGSLSPNKKFKGETTKGGPPAEVTACLHDASYETTLSRHGACFMLTSYLTYASL